MLHGISVKSKLLTPTFLDLTTLIHQSYLLLESAVITPVALTLSPGVIAGPSDDDTINIKSNSSCPSRTLSVITGTLTLLTVVPLVNVAISGVLLKSTPPVSQTFSEHMIIHNTQLPSADTGDFSDAITVT